VRSEVEFERIRGYIEANPVSAGLVLLVEAASKAAAARIGWPHRPL